MEVENEVLSRLSKKTRERIVTAREVSTKRLPLASIGLTDALAGGVGTGRITTIYGNKSAGKTSMLLQSIGTYQKQGLTCAWVDAENCFDPVWAERLGVDVDNLLVSKAKTIPDWITDGCELIGEGIDVFVTDSITALLPSTFFEKNDEFKDGMEGAKQIGQASKEIGVAMNKFNYLNEKTAIILISQTRKQFTTYGASDKPTGGQSVMFSSSTVIRLWSSAAEAQQITHDVSVGNKIYNVPLGRPVGWTVEYNKLASPNQIGTYDFYHKGTRLGVDTIGEVVDMAEKAGIVKKGGAWYSYGENKFQGKARLVAWLKDNQEDLEVIKKVVLGDG